MITEKPQVSIIVPVYNVEEYLPRCIESIIGQEEKGWELILIDDGSSDRSGQICDHYASHDSRITVIHKNNEGVSAARNLGMSLAKADRICFIDSDDWVETRYLSDLLALADDENTIVYGNLIHDYAGDKASVIGCAYKDGDCCNLEGKDAADFIVGKRIAENGYPSAKIFHRGILANDIHFNPNISLHEDHIFVLQCLLSAKRIVLSSKPNYHYVHRPPAAHSLSKKKHPARNMITASTELLKAVGAVVDKFSINDASYTKRLYTMLGLNQLVGAALNADDQEFGLVGNAIRDKKKLFKQYYSPNHSYVKIIPMLFFLKLDFVVLWISKILKGKHI